MLDVIQVLTTSSLVPFNASVRYGLLYLGSYRSRATILGGSDILVSIQAVPRPSRLTPSSGLVFFFIVGAVCPLVSYAVSLKWPNSIFKYVNFPVIFNGSQWIPPATAVNYVPWSIVGFIFNYVIRRRHFSWWTKYNCTWPSLAHC